MAAAPPPIANTGTIPEWSTQTDYDPDVAVSDLRTTINVCTPLADKDLANFSLKVIPFTQDPIHAFKVVLAHALKDPLAGKSNLLSLMKKYASNAGKSKAVAAILTIESLAYLANVGQDKGTTIFGQGTVPTFLQNGKIIVQLNGNWSTTNAPTDISLPIAAIPGLVLGKAAALDFKAQTSIWNAASQGSSFVVCGLNPDMVHSARTLDLLLDDDPARYFYEQFGLQCDIGDRGPLSKKNSGAQYRNRCRQTITRITTSDTWSKFEEQIMHGLAQFAKTEFDQAQKAIPGLEGIQKMFGLSHGNFTTREAISIISLSYLFGVVDWTKVHNTMISRKRFMKLIEKDQIMQAILVGGRTMQKKEKKLADLVG